MPPQDVATNQIASPYLGVRFPTDAETLLAQAPTMPQLPTPPAPAPAAAVAQSALMEEVKRRAANLDPHTSSIRVGAGENEQIPLFVPEGKNIFAGTLPVVRQTKLEQDQGYPIREQFEVRWETHDGKFITQTGWRTFDFNGETDKVFIEGWKEPADMSQLREAHELAATIRPAPGTWPPIRLVPAGPAPVPSNAPVAPGTVTPGAADPGTPQVTPGAADPNAPQVTPGAADPNAPQVTPGAAALQDPTKTTATPAATREQRVKELGNQIAAIQQAQETLGRAVLSQYDSSGNYRMNAAEVPGDDYDAQKYGASFFITAKGDGFSWTGWPSAHRYSSDADGGNPVVSRAPNKMHDPSVVTALQTAESLIPQAIAAADRSILMQPTVVVQGDNRVYVFPTTVQGSEGWLVVDGKHLPPIVAQAYSKVAPKDSNGQLVTGPLNIYSENGLY